MASTAARPGQAGQTQAGKAGPGTTGRQISSKEQGPTPLNYARSFVPAYGNLGSVLSAANKFPEAEQAYRMALRHRPNMAEVHYNL